MSKIFGQAEEANRWAQERPDDGGAAYSEKKRVEAAALQDFHSTMFGKTKQRLEWNKNQEAWEQHKRIVDQDERNFNFWRVTFPTGIWAKDPVTGQDRSPGEIDKAEFALEDISIRCYLALHGPGAPSGLPAWTNVSGGDPVEGGFIVPAEQAKAILDKASDEWELQAARVRTLRSNIEDKLVSALNPWRWNGGKIDQELIDRIEKAAMATPRSAGVSAIFGEATSATGAVGEGIDELIARAIRYDSGPGGDRSLAYCLALQFKDNPQFKGRFLMLGRALDDQALLDLFSFQSLYGPWATDKRHFSKLSPISVPEFIRYGTQAQLEKNLQDELERNQVA